MAFPEAPAEQIQDEIRQLELLGQAITIAFRSTLVEPLPHEIALLLDLLQLKEKEKVKPRNVRERCAIDALVCKKAAGSEPP